MKLKGETIDDLDKIIQHIDFLNIFSSDKTVISHEETLKQREKVRLTEILDKTNRVIKELEKTPEKKQTNYLLKEL